MNVVPGRGVDFAAVGRTLLLALVLYLAAALFIWIQARLLNVIVQRTVMALRADVEDKVHRLPLSYFDSRQRGELLSRVTNDVDNIQSSVSMTISQLLDLGAHRGGRAGDDADDLAAAGADHGGDGSVVAVGDSRDRAALTEDVHRPVDQHRPPQRPHRGDLQRLHRGQDVRASRRGAGEVPRLQRRRLSGQFRGTVLLRPGLAGDDVHRQPQLRRGRGGRRLPGGHRPDHTGQHPGLHPVRAAVQPAADPGRRHVQHAAVRGGQRGAGVRLPRRAGGKPRRHKDIAAQRRGSPRTGRVRRRLVQLPRRAPR